MRALAAATSSLVACSLIEIITGSPTISDATTWAPKIHSLSREHWRGTSLKAKNPLFRVGSDPFYYTSPLVRDLDAKVPPVAKSKRIGLQNEHETTLYHARWLCARRILRNVI